MAYLYLDDTTVFDAVRTDRAVLHLYTSAPTATFEGLQLESDLEELKRRGEDINMKINEKKTQLLVISPPNGYVTLATIDLGQGNKIESVGTLKLVGYTFGSQPSSAAHIESIGERFRRRV